MLLMKRILLGTACSLLFLMNYTEAQTMNNSTEALSPKERQIAAISAHTARGDMDGLKTALAAGLDAGLSLNEIREVLVQMYAYCGFPRSLNALSSLMELSKERAARGIKTGRVRKPEPLRLAGVSTSARRTRQNSAALRSRASFSSLPRPLTSS